MDSIANLAQDKAIDVDDPELWDPEIVAALQDDAQIDEDPENQLEDDFVSKALASATGTTGQANSKKNKNVIVFRDGQK